jgi:hypothetical protein
MTWNESLLALWLENKTAIHRWRIFSDRMTNLFTHIDKCLLKWIWFNTNRRWLFIQNFCKRSRCLEENPVFLFLSQKKRKKKEFLINVYWNEYGLIQTDATNGIVVYSFLAWLITESVYNDAFRTFTKDFILNFMLLSFWGFFWRGEKGWKDFF